MAFIGEYLLEKYCLIYKQPRYYDKKSRKGQCVTRKQFVYFPITYRLLRQFDSNFELAKALSTYRAGFDDVLPNTNLTNIFFKDVYQIY